MCEEHFQVRAESIFQSKTGYTEQEFYLYENAGLKKISTNRASEALKILQTHFSY